MPEIPNDLVLVGIIQKPYGLLGEVKVKPESFDFERHARLKEVYCLGRSDEEGNVMTVRGSRTDEKFWYLKFENHLTPESVIHLSGRRLMVRSEERLKLPEGMVYFSDLPGLLVFDETGEKLGEVSEVMETGAEAQIVVRTARGDVSVPWNANFVKRIDVATRRVEMDVSTLRGILF